MMIVVAASTPVTELSGSVQLLVSYLAIGPMQVRLNNPHNVITYINCMVERGHEENFSLFLLYKAEN